MDWKALWDTKQMLPFTDRGGVSSSFCKSGQVECSPANGSCRVEILCLPFQRGKHTELYGARHSAFVSQHIDLETVSAEMFMVAYSFCLHFWDSSSECWESSCCWALPFGQPSILTGAGSRSQAHHQRLLLPCCITELQNSLLRALCMSL